MGHIFISYSHADQEYVHKLHAALLSEGFDAWIDGRIDYGDQWPKVIQRHLDECDAFIIVMSQNSFESDMVQNEITRAREKKKNIFPILLDGESWLIVQAKQYVDVRDGSLPTEKFYKRLERVTPRTPKIPEREVIEKPAQKQAIRESEQKTPEKPWIPGNGIRPPARQSWPGRSKLLPWFKYGGIAIFVGAILWGGALLIPKVLGTDPTNTPSLATTVAPVVKSPTAVVRTNTPKPTSQLVAIPPTATATKALTVLGTTKTSAIDGMTQVRISGSGGVDTFWIDQSAVSNSMFEKFVNATSYITDAEKNGIGLVWTNLGEQPATQFPGQTGVVFEWKLVSGVNWKNPSRDKWLGDGNQVLQVSWNDALAYCQWAGRTLVTEAEWELARASEPSVNFYNSRVGLGEWGENKTTGAYRIVLGYRDVLWGYNSIFPERGFLEYRSANILTFRCKEK